MAAESTASGEGQEPVGSDTAYCTDCGTELDPSKDYCGECGAAQSKAQSQNDFLATFDDLLDQETEPKVAMGGAGVAIVGSFLPWASILGQSVLGIDGDGILTLLIGIGVLALVYTQEWKEKAIYGTIAGGALITVIPLFTLSSISAFGVYVTLLGGIAVLIAGISGYRTL